MIRDEFLDHARAFLDALEGELHHEMEISGVSVSGAGGRLTGDCMIEERQFRLQYAGRTVRAHRRPSISGGGAILVAPSPTLADASYCCGTDEDLDGAILLDDEGSTGFFLAPPVGARRAGGAP